MDEIYLTTKEVIKMFRIGRSKLWDIMSKREIEFIKMGNNTGKILIKKSEMERWMMEKTIKRKEKKKSVDLIE